MKGNDMALPILTLHLYSVPPFFVLACSFQEWLSFTTVQIEHKKERCCVSQRVPAPLSSSDAEEIPPYSSNLLRFLVL